MICPRPSATSTCTPSSSSVSRCQARSPGATGLDVISVRHLAGLGVIGLTACSACRESSRLPLHGLLPRRSCPHLVLISYELFIWYDDSLIEMTGTKHRGLAPHKITPMLGVHAPEDGMGRLQMDNHIAVPGDVEGRSATN